MRGVALPNEANRDTSDAIQACLSVVAPSLTW